ncbi:hypothetical protein AYI70_g9677 [Smittium culicis]|uniref:Uncharacterized protein n=1 Tax=Smittium culicis TaxID=133412 RepID=A0A1R1XA48_9FUNG|nr:hypothetical protein AYI70_g9677 [Smittium culicis]
MEPRSVETTYHHKETIDFVLCTEVQKCDGTISKTGSSIQIVSTTGVILSSKFTPWTPRSQPAWIFSEQETGTVLQMVTRKHSTTTECAESTIVQIQKYIQLPSAESDISHS